MTESNGNRDFELLVKRDDDELLRMLGEAVASSAAPHDYLQRGREIYENTKAKLHAEICNNEKLNELWNNNPVSNRTLIISQIIDVASAFMTGVAGATVAVLIYKEGLPEYCADIWGEKFESNSG